MAAIAHAFTEQNTAQTTTSTSYVDVTGATIASSEFVVGKKYLLMITAQIANNTSVGQCWLRAAHGTTAFAESERIHDIPSANEYAAYGWFTVWTAVSGEGIKLEFRSDNSARTATADQLALLAVNLSDDLTENTDWFFAESGTDLALTTTFQDGASITFTPATASEDWLVLSVAQIDVVTASTSSISRINRDGVDLTPEARYEHADNTVIAQYPLARVYSLTAASHTITEQAAETAADHTRFHSSLFVLNLHRFRDHAFAYTDADLSLSATNYATELQTISITPSVAGDVWIGGYWGHDRQDTAREGEFRVQVDNGDQPAGQTTDNRQFDSGVDATDEGPLILSTLANLTAATHTIDLDASADATTNTPAGQHRLLWAVTMELAAAGATSPGWFPSNRGGWW